MSKLDKSFDICRDPSKYEQSDHFRQKLKDRKVLDREMVAEAIEEGSVVKTDENLGGTDEALTLRHQWLMTTFEVVICPNDKLIKSAWEVEAE
jgi:hypothetical protein